MKTQSKIALILFTSYLAVLLLFGGAIFYFQNKFSYTDFYKRLKARASIAAKYNLETDRISADALMALRQQHLEKLPEEKEYLLEVNSVQELKIMASYYQLPQELLNDIFANNSGSLKVHDTFYSGIRYEQGNKNYIVVISAHNYYVSNHLNFLKNIIWIGIGLIALITIGFSLYFSKFIFAPIDQITEKVKHISAENMHLRLEEPSVKNEISELIHTFNDLLNRIETAFETQKNFISNASHEFGTPLTTIIGEAEVALIKQRSADEYEEVLQNILKQAERLDQITKSLLFLAQTGYGGKKLSFEKIRMDEIVWGAKEVMDRLNPHNKIYVDLSLLPEDPKKLKVKGNKELLHLAIANVFNNACKYSHNKPVSASIASGNNTIVIIIKDEGVGIPENELAFIYDPFFRASNAQRFEGYGIGLPLTRNIIRLHEGTMLVTSMVNEGTTVRIDLPLMFPTL